MLLRHLLSALVLSLISGCTEDPCKPSAHDSLEIGEGRDDFSPLGSPASMTLVYGPQGGVHVEVALLSRGLDASETWRVEIDGYQAGESLATSAETLQRPTCRQDGSGAEVTGQRLIFKDEVRPSDLEAPIDIVARVTDSLDNVATGTAEGVSVVLP